MGFGQTQLRHASAERLGDIDYARLMRIVRILRPRQFIRGFRKRRFKSYAHGRLRPSSARDEVLDPVAAVFFGGVELPQRFCIL